MRSVFADGLPNNAEHQLVPIVGNRGWTTKKGNRRVTPISENFKVNRPVATLRPTMAVSGDVIIDEAQWNKAVAELVLSLPVMGRRLNGA